MKEKPILQMGDIERERAFDGIAESINADLLSEARSGGHDPIVLAAVVLISGDGSRRIVTYNGEYGDGDERHYSGEFIGIGDSPQDALSSAIVHATDTIITRAERDQGFIARHIPEAEPQ